MPRRFGLALALAAPAALLLASCAEAPSQGELVEALERAGLTEAEATCAAAALYDHLSDDQIAAIADRGPNAVIDDTKDSDEPIDVTRREIAACRTTHEAAETTTTGDGSVSTTLPIDDTTTTSAG